MTETSKAAAADKPPVTLCAEKLAEDGQCDVLLYSGEMMPNPIDKAMALMDASRSGKHLVMVLATFGGDPHSSYQLSRYIQDHYEDFTLLVGGMCKSAGTMIAVGANRLAFGPRGQLGPLDIQLRKQDEIGDYSSSLTSGAALAALEEQAVKTFYKMSSEMKSRWPVTLKLAFDVSAKMTTDVLQGIYGRIDPLDLGEKYRAVRIGNDYAQRGNIRYRNVREERLRDLVEKYSDHAFVIDYREAQALFHRVRKATEAEMALLTALGQTALYEERKHDIRFLATYTKKDSSAANDEKPQTTTNVTQLRSEEEHDATGEKETRGGQTAA